MSESEAANSSNEEKEEKEGEEEEKEEKEEEDEEKEENEDEEDEEKEEEEEKKEEKGKKEKKKSKEINKFLNSKLLPSNEIKIDLKGTANSSGVFGIGNYNNNNISNNSFVTATFPIRPSLQILTDINQEMDLLSSNINDNIMSKYAIPSLLPKENISYFNSNNNYNYNYNNYYDKEDLEIKELINKTNQILNGSNNNNNFNTISNYYDYRNKPINRNNLEYNGYNHYNTISNFHNPRRRKFYGNSHARHDTNEYNYKNYNNNYYNNNDSEYYSIGDSEEGSIDNYRNMKRYHTYGNRNKIYKDNPHFQRFEDRKNEYNGANYNDNQMTNSSYLYQYTYGPKRKMRSYSQPDSFPNNRNGYINKKYQYTNYSNENNGYNNNYYFDDREIGNSKNRYLRYNTVGPDRDINVLRGID